MSTYDDASLIYYPSGYKAGKAYSLKPTDGSGDLTFTRASTATRVNEQGLIETASVISPTELITNGDFATDSGWAKGTGWTISGGLAIGTSVPNSVALYQTPLTIGKKYKITFDLVSISSGGVRERIGGTPNPTIRTSVGTYSYTQVADSSIAGIIASSSGFSGTIDNVSVKEVIENNVPRIDYTGGGCGKLLLEPQRTNLVFPSATASTQTVITTAQSYTLSFYGTGTVVRSGTSTGTLLGTGANDRVFVTFTATAGSLTLSVTGSVTNWQLESGSFPTSIIPTTTTAVTRVADSASVTTPAGVTQITETFGNGSTNVITSIPATYTASLGNIQSVIMI